MRINKKRSRKESANFSAKHFLINKSLIHELIRLAGINRNDVVVDIGAGNGAITFPLADRAGTVIAIENDPVSVGKIKSQLTEHSNIRVWHMDALQYRLPRSPFCVVANIPFSITTAIFDKLLGDPTVFLQRAVFIIEKGAAKRFTSVPITNPIILTWRMGYDIRLMKTVPPHNFAPPPSVDSAVVAVLRKKNPLVPAEHRDKFYALACHTLRYPQMPFCAAVREIFTSPQIARVVKELKMERNQPISSLSEEQWARLCLAMLRHVEPYRWPKLRKRRK